MILPEEAGMPLTDEQEPGRGLGLARGRGHDRGLGARRASSRPRTCSSGRAEVDAESAIRLIYEETCLRREAGQSVATAEVVARFPRWGAELRALFECDRLIRSPRGIAHYPEAGEVLGPFLLLAELGRGHSGRTFLASDPSLADRPVVVKVIPDDQRRASGPGPAAAHAHRSAFLRAHVPGARPSRALHAVPGRHEPGAHPGRPGRRAPRAPHAASCSSR